MNQIQRKTNLLKNTNANTKDHKQNTTKKEKKSMKKRIK